MKSFSKFGDFLRATFPERQIYHRTGGTVRYFTISPFQQMVIAGVAAAALTWTCIATAGFVFFNNGSIGGASDGQVHKLERWLQEVRAKEALSSEQLTARTDAFQRATIDFERRHQTLETMLTALKTGGELDVSALRGDSASLLVTATIDEADSRQSQRLASVPDALPQVGLSGQVSEIRTSQAEFLNEVEEIAVERAEAARGVLRLTKVGASRIESGENMGGPAIEFSALVNGNFSSPEEAQFAADALQKIGLGGLVTDFEKRLNRGAEEGAKEALSIFGNAIKQMTFSDVKNILLGGENSATNFFRNTTAQALYDKFSPKIKTSLDQVNATKVWTDITTKYNSIPFTRNKEETDLVKYATNKAMDGLFLKVAEEEKKIRENPVARTSELLRSVFGYADKQKQASNG